MKRIFVIILIVTVYSCDLLTTRTPEEPVVRRSERQLATTPDILFSNLKSSLKERFVDDYMSCFVDTVLLKREFKFIPATEAVSQYPILAEWKLSNEKDYFVNMLSQTVEKTPINLTLTQTGVNNFGDSAFYQFNYSIVLTALNEGVSPNYKGNLKFKINLDNSNQWVITEWEDVKDGETPSWSDLKGLFAN